ncbi:MAG: type III-A CRISPR-associated protein Cas10/Csm1, partial [Ignavibacteriaceae bacterium]|nr:type III-A CRISPR-associated protein Cas10/Csm1 [Ignavibacteriaceae bacterium]
MTAEEKTLILGALFHDIGKFEQRCTGNPNKKYHQELGKELILSGRFQHRFEKIVGKDNINHLAEAVLNHHQKSPADNLTKIIQQADRLSASERVDKEEVEAYQDQWKHKHLASLFSKIKLLSNEQIEPKYYKHKLLTKKDYDVIIPTETKESELKEFAYKESDWTLFLEDLEYVLDIYESDQDFESLINLLLIIFEKYMWCVPDFTGSSETDISLYNHLKDVAGLAHSIYLTRKETLESTNLNLVIGDIPGIQSYIFDVVHKKPAKILRGRSIFVQVLTRNLATKLLKTFGLTEVNLIMLAGGKFYLIAPDTEKFKKEYEKVLYEINNYLFNNFRMDLSFNCAYHTFNYKDLMEKDNPLTFGKIVEDASYKLIEKRYKLFNERLFPKDNSSYQNYIWEEKYINDDGTGTDSIKCKITDKPIREGRKRIITDPEGDIIVDLQVKNEYEIGFQITGNNIIAILNDDNLTINPDNINPIKKFKENDDLKKRNKLLFNPTLDDLLKKENLGKNIFKNTHYIEVANYCSRNESNEIMPFEDMAEQNNGAEFLALIKGDIDNLGLIMAYGLDRDKKVISDDENEKDLTSISRTTTLSNHLKYFFSFFLNGFLAEWEQKSNDNKVYTIFAGGDDLMLVTPQSSALKLIKALNDEFKKFTCDNNEVHISYSITHFKDHTPIRIVADFAEDNQKEGKRFTQDDQYKLLKTKNELSFVAEYDKAGTFLFDTFVKNEQLDYLMKQIEKLTFK